MATAGTLPAISTNRGFLVKRISGVLAGAALAGSMGIGMATSAQASTADSSSSVVASSETGSSSAYTCRYRLINRGVRVWCAASLPGNAFRAGVKCKSGGRTFWRYDAWRVQGTGYSQAVCPSGSTRIAIRAQYR